MKTTPREGGKQRTVANITGSKLKHSRRELPVLPSQHPAPWAGLLAQGCSSPQNHQAEKPPHNTGQGAELFLGSFTLVSPTCGTPASRTSFLSPWHPFQKHTLSVQPDFTYVLSLSFFAYLTSHVSWGSVPPVCCWHVVCATVWGKGDLGHLGSAPISPLCCSVVSDSPLHCSMFSHRSQKSGHPTERSLYSHSSCLVLTLSTTSPADSSLPVLALLLHHWLYKGTTNLLKTHRVLASIRNQIMITS